jgi:hypothetical protein
MVWTGRFEKLLEVISGLSHLVLEIMLDSRNVFLVGVVCLLVVIIIAASNSDPLGAPLLPLFTALGASLTAFPGGFGRHPSCR